MYIVLCINQTPFDVKQPQHNKTLSLLMVLSDRQVSRVASVYSVISSPFPSVFLFHPCINELPEFNLISIISATSPCIYKSPQSCFFQPCQHWLFHFFCIKYPYHCYSTLHLHLTLLPHHLPQSIRLQVPFLDLLEQAFSCPHLLTRQPPLFAFILTHQSPMEFCQCVSQFELEKPSCDICFDFAEQHAQPTHVLEPVPSLIAITHLYQLCFHFGQLDICHRA